MTEHENSHPPAGADTPLEVGALLKAATHGRTMRLTWLLKTTNALAICNGRNTPVLYHTLCAGQSDAAAKLIDAKASIYAFGPRDRSPLMAASMRGDIRNIDKLLDAGLVVNAKDEDGWSALHYAAWKGHKDAYEALVKHGADKAATNNLGETAMDVATDELRQAFVAEKSMAHAKKVKATKLKAMRLKRGR